MSYRKSALLTLMLALALAARPAFADSLPASSGSASPPAAAAPEEKPAGSVPSGEAGSPAAPDDTPAPVVLVSRNEIRSPLRPGRKTDLTLTFRNLGKTDLIAPVAVFSPSDSLMIDGGSSSFSLEDIPAQGSRTLTIKLLTTDTISSAVQSLGVDLRYSYRNGEALTQGTVSDRITLPATVRGNEKHSQPPVLVTRSALEPITPNQEFPVTLSIRNAGDVTMENVVASVTTSDGLVLQNTTSTFIIEKIGAGRTESLPLKLRAGRDLAGTQSVTLDLKYSYDAGEETAQGTATERINILTDPAETAGEGSVPNLIVSDYRYGEGTVASGGRFPLDFTLLNTGKRAVENIIVTVDGGDSFTVDGSSNTLYYEQLAAAGKQKQVINMQALPTAKSGAQTIGITCKYEYTDGGKRSAASAEIRLSVPVHQPDRFQVSAPTPPGPVSAGEEVTLSLPYVNKGREEVSNVEAVIEGEVESPSKSQYLGNFDPGKSGSIGFVFTPMEPGKTDITLKVSYEDANQELHTLTFPVKLEVGQPMEDLPDDTDLAEPESGSGVSPWLLAAGAGVLGIGGFLGIRARRRKKSAAPAVPDESDWDDWDEDPDESASGPEDEENGQ